MSDTEERTDKDEFMLVELCKQFFVTCIQLQTEEVELLKQLCSLHAPIQEDHIVADNEDRLHELNKELENELNQCAMIMRNNNKTMGTEMKRFKKQMKRSKSTIGVLQSTLSEKVENDSEDNTRKAVTAQNSETVLPTVDFKTNSSKIIALPLPLEPISENRCSNPSTMCVHSDIENEGLDFINGSTTPLSTGSDNVTISIYTPKILSRHPSISVNISGEDTVVVNKKRKSRKRQNKKKKVPNPVVHLPPPIPERNESSHAISIKEPVLALPHKRFICPSSMSVVKNLKNENTRLQIQICILEGKMKKSYGYKVNHLFRK